MSRREMSEAEKVKEWGRRLTEDEREQVTTIASRIGGIADELALAEETDGMRRSDFDRLLAACEYQLVRLKSEAAGWPS